MSLSNNIWAEQPAPSCWHCEKPCPQENAYRCLACKGWFHATCLGIHFGGTLGAESNDQQRIRHLENELEFWQDRRLLAAEHSLQSANQELEYYEQTASFRKTLDRERQARRERTP